MAFVKIEKSRQSGDDRPVVTMGSYLADGKAHKGKSVAFRISYTLLGQLGWLQSDGRVKIGVFEGTDKDAGFLQLARAEDGYMGTTKDKTSQGLSINVTIERFKHYVLNECPVPSHAITHTTDGDTLIIECPDWLRFNPQSVPQPVPETKIVDMHPGRGHRRTRR